MSNAKPEERPIVRRTESGINLSVRVQPGAAGTEFAGVSGGQVRVRLRAPAREGQANSALCEFLGKTLGLPKSCITIARGASSRDKTVHIDGDPGAIIARLEAAFSGLRGT
jgi:uncharacterized protein (TIGR00251 family)